MSTPTESGYYWARELVGSPKQVRAGREIVLFTTTATSAGGYVRRIGDNHLRVPSEFQFGPRVAEPPR